MCMPSLPVRTPLSCIPSSWACGPCGRAVTLWATPCHSCGPTPFSRVLGFLIHAQGGRLVSGIETDETGNVVALVARDTATGQEERLEADAVVFAISIAGGHFDIGTG